MNYNLGSHISIRFYQYRIHIYIRFQARCLRLHDLRPPHLSAIFSDERVKRHILCLKGRHIIPVLPEYPAECSN